MKKPIHYFSRGYYVLRYYMAFLMARFYRKIEVKGKENIPKDKPVLFAINHQNALMDALTILQTYKGQPVFMARADIFKQAIVAKVLRWLKILPIFRIRDGVKNLQNNDAVFDEAILVLKDKKRLAILPEGNHSGQHRLRVLKKGIARIAFAAEEAEDFNLDIQVIPVGLHYFHYQKYNKDLIIDFGKPFSLKPFIEEYKENPQRGMSVFMSELRERMLPQMLHINSGEHYQEIDAILECYRAKYKVTKAKGSSLIDRRKVEQAVSDSLITLLDEKPEEFNALAEKAMAIKEELSNQDLRHWVLNKEKYSLAGLAIKFLCLLLFFPLFLLGALLNIVPFQLPAYLTRKVKDPQFVSSLNFGYSLVIYPLYYGILLALYMVFLPKVWLALVFIVLTPIIGKIAYLYTTCYKRTKAKCRANRIFKKKNTAWMKVLDYYKDIQKALT